MNHRIFERKLRPRPRPRACLPQRHYELSQFLLWGSVDLAVLASWGDLRPSRLKYMICSDTQISHSVVIRNAGDRYVRVINVDLQETFIH